MSYGEKIGLLYFLKALSDENRLQMLGLLSNKFYSIEELAAEMEQPVDVTRQQLSRLRETGLVNLRTRDKQYIYSINQVMVDRFKEMVFDLEKLAKSKIEPKPDDSWVDDLPLTEDDRKVLKGYIYDGRLKHIPDKSKKMASVLRWLATCFEAGTVYTEQEVNAIITRYHEDYATLRRGLIDLGLLNRESGGRTYWLVSQDG